MSMRISSAVLALGASAFVLSGCSTPVVHQGTIAAIATMSDQGTSYQVLSVKEESGTTVYKCWSWDSRRRNQICPLLKQGDTIKFRVSNSSLIYDTERVAEG